VSRVSLGPVPLGDGAPLVLIAGPCVIESESHALDIARELARITAASGVPLIFKASFDKANRTSVESYRGPGLVPGLRVLDKVKQETGLPVLTDIHEVDQAGPAGAVVDVLQIPAFLSRQTDLIVAAAKTGRAVNIKKGQFLAPRDVRHAVAKVTASGNRNDMRAFPMIRELGVPVVFDVTHSLQLPGAGDGVTAGLAQYIDALARAGVGAGVDGVFLEVHEDPARAMSDGQNALRLDRLEPLLRQLVQIDAIARAS
jgi:2-dehydro-3-deoxyphosphooctonate aldolase (KDO 8-P synthase)